ncbi:PTS system, Fru family, IIB component domain protein, partial [Vibrio parahaemolyticus VPTS-2010]
EQV